MFKNFFKGISAYSGAFSLIGKLGLWKYFFIPILISVFTAIFISLLAWGWADHIGEFIAKIWVWEWGAETFRAISNFIGGVTVIAIGLILYKNIILALSAPFMAPVSEKIEQHLTGKEIHTPRSQFFPLLLRGIRVNLRNLGMELLLTIPILLLGLVPLIGVISTPLLFMLQAYYAGFGNMDYTLERHLNFSKSMAFVRAHSGLAMGNGSIFLLFLLIPLIGVIFVLPFSVTAASTSTLETLIKPSQKDNIQ